MTILDSDAELLDAPAAGDDRTDAVLSDELERLLAGSGTGGSSTDDDDELLQRRPNRVALAIALPSFGAAVMAGGVFEGAGGRIVACLAVALGILLALFARRIVSPGVANVAILVGIFLIGLVGLGISGFGNLPHVTQLVQQAVKDGNVLRPPVQFLPGWHAVVAWLCGGVAFTALWVALVFDKPSLGLLVPLPFAAICGISVPASQQVASGIVVVVLFAAGLGVLSGSTVSGESDQRPTLGYELRRAGRGVALIAVLTVVLIGLSKTGFLFPKPAIDPAHQAQLPKAAPLSAAPDRPLFTVTSPQNITGPWRQGSLDVYDGAAWRLAAVADSNYTPVPASGIVDNTRPLAITADFTIEGYQGAVLPGLPETVGVAVQGPAVQYDHRNDNIRLVEGQVEKGLTYRVAAAGLPTLAQLETDRDPIPDDIRQFLSVPATPPGVEKLLVQMHKDNAFDTFNALRGYILDTVVATGAGVPEAVPPSKVDDLLVGSKKGSPFDIVAAQALVARWAGIPSRIGYGFNGGTKVGNALQVSPANAASFVEIYFPKYGWLPIIGNPKHAEANANDTQKQQQSSDVQAASNFGANVYLPRPTAPTSATAKTVLAVLIVLAGITLIGYLIYFFLPALVKARRRSRLRTAAAKASPRARLALAYAEWRDTCTDYGYGYAADPPLGFLVRFAPDDEHAELAWLVTRALWGDLRNDVTPAMVAAAEELSRALRRRLSGAHTVIVRLLAGVSRASVRSPYSADLIAVLTPPKKEKLRGTAAPAVSPA